MIIRSVVFILAGCVLASGLYARDVKKQVQQSKLRCPRIDGILDSVKFLYYFGYLYLKSRT